MPEHRSSQPVASRAAASVDALLALGDEAFVRTAYHTLLGREADSSGLVSYLGQVRAGEAKSSLVVQMALSDEGQQRPRTLPGLEALLQAARPLPWHKRLARQLLRPWRQTPAEPIARAFRIMDNRLVRIEALVHAQSSDMASVRADMTQVVISLEVVRQITAAAASVAGGAPGATPPAPPAAVVSSVMPNIPLQRQAPLRVEQLYRGLRRMWARTIGMPHH